MNKIIINSGANQVVLNKIIMGGNQISASIAKQTNQSGYEYACKCYDKYIDNGGNTFDTARVYGQGASEGLLARYLTKYNRPNYVLITKGCHHSKERKRVTPSDIEQDINKSLQELKTDYVDVYLLHRDDITQDVGPIMECLHKQVMAGKAKSIGVSNWTAGRIAMANKYAIDNNLTPFTSSQICYSLALSTPAISGDVTHVMINEAEWNWYKDNNFPVMAWSPQARGFFVKAINNQPIVDSVAKYYSWLDLNFRRATRVKNLAQELKVSYGAIVLAYVLNQPFPAMTVCSTSNFGQLDEVLEADNIRLTSAQIEYLETKRDDF